VKTVLFLGAGRHQRRAIARLRELGVRVVAVDRKPAVADADIAETVDFADVEAAADVGRRHGVEGVMTVASERAVPAVAAVAERLGLPSIGVAVAHRMTNKAAMRAALRDAGVPQPAHAAVHDIGDARDALAEIDTPAVLKPVDSAGQRGLSRVETEADLDAALDAALDHSPSGEALLEELVEGVERNAMLVVRSGEPLLLTLSDRLRPQGRGFGVALAHVYPCSLDEAVFAATERIACDAVRALGLRDGIAYPQLLVDDGGRIVVVEVAARIPGGQMDSLVRVATGVDLVEVALRQALGEPVGDELAVPRVSQPLAIRFLTSTPGSLPRGQVRRVGTIDALAAAPGVVQAETYLQPGETIRPVQVDGDRRGYVIAVADTPVEALARADAAAGLLEVEVES
jgi:biotin carboxylase